MISSDTEDESSAAESQLVAKKKLMPICESSSESNASGSVDKVFEENQISPATKEEEIDCQKSENNPSKSAEANYSKNESIEFEIIDENDCCNESDVIPATQDAFVKFYSSTNLDEIVVNSKCTPEKNRNYKDESLTESFCESLKLHMSENINNSGIVVCCI